MNIVKDIKKELGLNFLEKYCNKEVQIRQELREVACLILGELRKLPEYKDHARVGLFLYLVNDKLKFSIHASKDLNEDDVYIAYKYFYNTWHWRSKGCVIDEDDWVSPDLRNPSKEYIAKVELILNQYDSIRHDIKEVVSKFIKGLYEDNKTFV